MEFIDAIIPDKLKIGSVLIVDKPIFSFNIGTLLFIYNIDHNGIVFVISEDRRLFSIYPQNEIFFSFLQYLNVNYFYNDKQFYYDYESAYFKILFHKIKRLSMLN